MVESIEITEEQKSECFSILTEMIGRLGLQVEVSEGKGRGFTASLKTDEPGRLIGRKGHYLNSLEKLLNRIMKKNYEGFPRISLSVTGYGGNTGTRKPRSGDKEERRNTSNKEKNVEKIEKCAEESAPVNEDVITVVEPEKEQVAPIEDPQLISSENRRPRHTGGVDEERMKQIAIDAAKEVKRWGQPKLIGPFNSAERRLIHLALKEDEDIETISSDSGINGKKKIQIKSVN